MKTTASTAPASARAPSARDVASSQDALSELVVSGLVTLDGEIEALVRPMGAAMRDTSPPAGGWSVDSILEHLCLTSELYLARMSEALAAHGAPREGGKWRPTLSGRLLAWSMTSSFRLKAPRVVVPGPAPRPDVLDAFLRSNDALRSMLHSASDREWRRVRFSSPLARGITLNLGDAALVLLRHGERHHQQMTRVARSLSG